jgi:1,4-alpha-glucan branching enzyme
MDGRTRLRITVFLYPRKVANMNEESGAVWRFHVSCPNADRVYLVQRMNGINKHWLPMLPSGQDAWELDIELSPGHYEVSYFSAEGDTYFNGSSYGLTATSLGENDPRVIVEPMEQPLPA